MKVIDVFDWVQQVPKGSMPMDQNTNNYKLLKIFAGITGQTYIGMQGVMEWQSIDVATGKALDAIGRNYGEYRGEADDRFYRFMIKSRIAVARSKGTGDDIINIIAGSLAVNPNQIEIVNNRQLSDGSLNGKTLSVSVRNLPLGWAKTDFEKRYIVKRIQETVAEGIQIEDITFVDISHAQMYASAAATLEAIYDVKESKLQGV